MWDDATLAMAGLIGLVLAGTTQAAAPEGAVPIGGFAIDATEVTVEAFARHAAALGLQTAAEREGGGHEYVGGWQRRPGWSYRSPSGTPAQPTDPAAHLTWFEARDYCAAKGGAPADARRMARGRLHRAPRRPERRL